MKSLTLTRAMCLSFSLLAAGWSGAAVAAGSVVVVAHPDTPVMDGSTVQRVFLGKVVQVDGKTVTPVNLVMGGDGRATFMQHVLEQDDEKFIGYWTVRRYIGRGVPPRELASVEEMIDYLSKTPGAIGYLPEAQVGKGLKVLFKRP